MLTIAVRLSTLCLALILAGATATTDTDRAKNRFYRAYYLEQEKGDWSAAAKVYEKVAEDRNADRALRARAEARLATCREELASRDLTRLMPPDAWAYIELNRPGDQILKLLHELGLVAGPEHVIGEGANRLAISPVLVKEILGIGGAAVAVTGFDPANEVPQGVLVFHPGKLRVIRAALETGLPAGGRVVEPIGGYPTFDVEGEAFITLTARLVIVSTERDQIEGVVSRLHGETGDSLATNPAIKEIIADRDDALVMFFVNAKAMMPLLMGAMASEMSGEEFAMANAVLDIESLQSVHGRFGISDDGILLDVGLRLDDGHHNLVYNLLRTPAINPDTLACVPEGVAAVWIGALNEAGSSYSGGSVDNNGTPVVTFLDFGRELFANITSMAVFALPPDGEASSGPPIPDIAAAISVNDPAKSEALWSMLLGVAGMAAGAPGIEGAPIEIHGVTARNFELPEGIHIYFATVGDDVVIASTKSAMARTIKAKRSGQSILEDEAYGATISRMGPATTKAVFVHAGRCADIAKRFVPRSELEEVAPVLALLSDTVGSFVVEHSGEQFRFSTMVNGIPDVGDVVAQLIAEEHGRGAHHRQLKRAVREKNWDTALETVDAQLANRPEDLDLLRTKFKILAVEQGDRDAARACGKAFFKKAHDKATALNNFAWALLTEDQYDDAYTGLAVKVSERSNELTKYENWAFLDTLALANFKAGDAASAVELEKKAIEHSGGRGKAELEKALAKFEKALNE